MNTLSTYFNQREIKRIESCMHDPVPKDFHPKGANYIEYLFKHIKPEYFDFCIKYFQDQKTKMTNQQYLIGLAGLCKSIITVPNIWRFYFSIFDDSHILRLPEYIKVQNKLQYDYLRCVIIPDVKDNVKNPIDLQLRKLSLMGYDCHYWSIFIKMVKKNYSEGLFHRFNFEEAIFFLYYNTVSPFIVFSKRKYHEQINFYINCLAAAVKTFMDKFHYICDKTSFTQNNDETDLSEKIFLDFLDFYETHLMLNEDTCKYYQ